MLALCQLLVLYLHPVFFHFKLFDLFGLASGKTLQSVQFHPFSCLAELSPLYRFHCGSLSVSFPLLSFPSRHSDRCDENGKDGELRFGFAVVLFVYCCRCTAATAPLHLCRQLISQCTPTDSSTAMSLGGRRPYCRQKTAYVLRPHGFVAAYSKQPMALHNALHSSRAAPSYRVPVVKHNSPRRIKSVMRGPVGPFCQLVSGDVPNELMVVSQREM